MIGGLVSTSKPVIAGLIETSGTYNPSSKLIELFGTIDKTDVRIDVNLNWADGQIPTGVVSVLKHETNATSDTWGAWEISLNPENSSAYLPGTFYSDKFAQVAVFSDRIVFYDGIVMPGETLTKFFQLNHAIEGTLTMSHSKRPLLDEVTDDAINNGFPPPSETTTVDITLQTVPEPSSTLSLLALGTLGAALTFKRKLKHSKSIEKVSY